MYAGCLHYNGASNRGAALFAMLLSFTVLTPGTMQTRPHFFVAFATRAEKHLQCA